MIRAISTRYKGYNFRSRLEARWAVFFDAAGIKWEYEAQGFVVGKVPYLPDFYLPELVCYFEVKGSNEYDPEFFRCFAREIECRVVVAEGQIPSPQEITFSDDIGLQVFDPSDAKGLSGGSMAWGQRDMFLVCDGCDRIAIMNEVYSSLKGGCSCGDEQARLMPLSGALTAARAARFEHRA